MESIVTEDVTSAVDESKCTKVKTNKLVCVEYPGFVKNVDKMLATMGGEKKISETFYKGKCRLQMTYRPEDLNAHFVCADLVPCTGLLMKVQRRRKKKSEKMDSTSSVNVSEKVEVTASDTESPSFSKSTDKIPIEYEYKQEIIGVVKDQYKFQTLMDYQYLAPEPMWNYYKEIHGSELADENFPPYFPPPIFGRIDTCGSYDYRPDPVLRKNALISRDLSEKFQSNTDEGAGYARKRRQAESMAALFDNETVPQGPSQGAIKIIENLKRGSDTEAVNTIQKLFEERPIWSKLAISCHIDVTLERLKKIIQYFAYYWLSGPWRTMWCRMGYDPRKDPKSKVYQMLDFRIRDSKESKKSYKMLVPKRSYKNYIPRNLQSRVLPHGSSVLAASEQPLDEENVDSKPYIFSPDKMIASRNMMYQLCDIHDPEVIKIIQENDGEETVCNEKEGWFPLGTMSRIRIEMVKTVDSYFEVEKQKRKDSKMAENNDSSSIIETSDYSIPPNELADDSFDDFSLPNDDSAFQPSRYLQMLQENNEDGDVDDSYDNYDGEYYDDE